MNIVMSAKLDMIEQIKKTLETTSFKPSTHSQESEKKYEEFISSVKKGKKSSVELPLDYAINDELFELVKNEKVFISSSVKFVTTFTTERPTKVDTSSYFKSRYKGNELAYYFLDNHPGIINIDKLKDIPIDYEGLMAVPPTVLEYKNIDRFNIHRIIYTPRHRGRVIYPRIVISNKVAA